MNPMHHTLLRGLGIVATVLVLIGCGWHPRGSGEFALPMQQIHLHSAHAGEAVPTRVAQLLRTSGVELLGTTGHAMSLYIGGEQRGVRKVALDRSARSAEQEMRVTVVFEVRDAEGTTVLGPRTVTASRIYAYDQNSIVALQSEEALILQELRDSIAEQIVRQLRHAPLGSAAR